MELVGHLVLEVTIVLLAIFLAFPSSRIKPLYRSTSPGYLDDLQELSDRLPDPDAPCPHCGKHRSDQ